MSGHFFLPAYQLHRASGQARVRIQGFDHYLGPHGLPESHERYQDLVAEWRIRHCDADRYTLTVDNLELLYLEFAKQHYRKADRETSEVHWVRSALRYLVAVAGPMRTRDFGPKLLKQVRERMVAAGDCRNTVNSNVGRIRRIFKWAVADELPPATVLTALQAVQGLQAGRCKALIVRRCGRFPNRRCSRSTKSSACNSGARRGSNRSRIE